MATNYDEKIARCEEEIKRLRKEKREQERKAEQRNALALLRWMRANGCAVLTRERQAVQLDDAIAAATSSRRRQQNGRRPS